MKNLYVKRFLLIFLASVIGVWLLSEIAFGFQKADTDRAPTTVEITIPAGTADRVAAGESVPSLPEEMVFVIGDVLLVHNQDNVTHELGPVLVPQNSSASIPMEFADSFQYSCSFQPSKYLGVEIVEPTTWETRILAILFAAPPTSLIVFLYSLAVRPIEVEGEGILE